MSVEIVSSGETWVVKFLNRTFGGGPAVDVLKVNGKSTDGPLGAIMLNAAPMINGATQATATGYLQTIITSSVSSAQSITCTGAKVGDKVISVIDLTSQTDVTVDFESTISIVNKVQQITGTAAHPCIILITHQS